MKHRNKITPQITTITTEEYSTRIGATLEIAYTKRDHEPPYIWVERVIEEDCFMITGNQTLSLKPDELRKVADVLSKLANHFGVEC